MGITPTQKGSLRLFQLGGITVFLHWSWFVVAAWELSQPLVHYQIRAWNALEYLALFAIVLLHEFGHALACRSVGGESDQIVLWPLGGVAYVNPPPRPGPTLWSIAAGPLVNVVLLLGLSVLDRLGRAHGWWAQDTDFCTWLGSLLLINKALLVLNLLPIYPLDGGQILRSLLWFVIGRARSLLVTAVLGLIGVVGLIAIAVLAQSVWIGVIAVFILMNCWRGLQAARAMVRLDRLPRHDGFACPACHTGPPRGDFWRCHQCGTAFDTFASNATCPSCTTQFPLTRCLSCGRLSPMTAWTRTWSGTPPPIVDVP